jgi:hypothetical protein
MPARPGAVDGAKIVSRGMDQRFGVSFFPAVFAAASHRNFWNCSKP